MTNIRKTDTNYFIQSKYRKHSKSRKTLFYGSILLIAILAVSISGCSKSTPAVATPNSQVKFLDQIEIKDNSY